MTDALVGSPIYFLTMLKSDADLVQLELFPYGVRFLSYFHPLSDHFLLVLPLFITLDSTVKR